jgi:hypothetical protein
VDIGLQQVILFEAHSLLDAALPGIVRCLSDALRIGVHAHGARPEIPGGRNRNAAIATT